MQLPRSTRRLALGALALTSLAAPALAQISVPTQQYDNARSGANTSETRLTPQNVNVTHFGKLFAYALNANVNGQVLYVPNLTISGAVHNVIFAYTSNNVNGSPCGLYAFDADSPQSGKLWSTRLNASAEWTTAAPTIDVATNTLYALTKADNDNGLTQLNAFDLLTGRQKPGSPITIQASVPGTGDASKNGVVSFDTTHANDRAALLLVNSDVYVSFSHATDSYPYHGWVLGYHYDGVKFAQTGAFCTTPNGGDGGIWMAGKGLTADAKGYVYCSVGNGTFDANTGGKDYGMCYVKLHTPDLSVADYFAPFDEKKNSDLDLDTGNSGLAGIPGTALLFSGGTKFGSLFVLDSTNLGRFTAGGPDKVVDRVNEICASDSIGQNPVAWDTGGVKYLYLWPEAGGVQQYRYDPSIGMTSPHGIYKENNVPKSGGGLTVTSNGTASAILWALGDDAIFRAFDATDVSKPELWNSVQNSRRDALPSVGHFQFPTVVNGKAYVPTGRGQIYVYGLLP